MTAKAARQKCIACIDRLRTRARFGSWTPFLLFSMFNTVSYCCIAGICGSSNASDRKLFMFFLCQSAEPFSHRTGTLRCLQKEMATCRHWSVSLWRDPDDVPQCRILSSDKAEWRLIPAALCRWRRCFLADQLWLRMKTLFCGWPVMVDDTHTRRRIKPQR